MQIRCSHRLATLVTSLALSASLAGCLIASDRAPESTANNSGASNTNAPGGVTTSPGPSGGTGSGTTGTGTGTGTTTSGSPLTLNASGHVTVERMYKGACAPAGSRGGCYSITLRPDGSYTHVLLDAGISGTYVVVGSQVNFTPSGGAPASSLALSADGSRLGDLQLQ
jgi:hypothetical protein